MLPDCFEHNEFRPGWVGHRSSASTSLTITPEDAILVRVRTASGSQETHMQTWRSGVPVVFALAALLLAGCASTSQIADQVVKSNLAQERASNQLLLLNIVRAYHRRPMHFTQISAIRLPVGLGNPTFTIPTPFGPDFTQQVYGVSTSIAVQQGVDTAPLVSQEFMRGITTPLPPSLMLYYLDQGWPQQMVLHLFVRSIEIHRGKKLITEYVNYPENMEKVKEFQEAIEGLLGCELEAAPVGGKPYGPAYSPAQLADIRGLAAAKAAELALEPRGDPQRPTSFQFVRASREVQLTARPRQGSHSCRLPGGALSLYATASAERAKGQDDEKVSANFVLRSPEAMVYYLGEVARAQRGYGRRAVEHGAAGVPSDPLTFAYGELRAETFKANRAILFELNSASPAEAMVSVEYEGEFYTVAKGSASNRSTHVLSLLTQVLGLQNRGVELPSTTNVRVVQ
jgi:hypothetical protein